jgi:hypothetical protein
MTYIEFIENCRSKDYTGLVTHCHHIIPRSQGGSNDESNLINLSVHDHFWAHLYYAQETKKCMSAPHLILKSFCAKSDFTEEEWNYAVIKSLKILSDSRKGTIFSEEHRKKLSEKKIGNLINLGRKATPEQREKMKNAKLGKPGAKYGKKVSPEGRLNISKAGIGNKNALGWKPTEDQINKMRNAKLGKSWKLVDGKRVWFEKEKINDL